MKKLIFIIACFANLSCNDNLTDSGNIFTNKPKITNPIDKSEFNSSEEIKIEWEADSVGYFETQLLNNKDRFYTNVDIPLFNSSSLHSSKITTHYYSFIVDNSLQFDMYFGFRVRQVIENDTSNWSDIISFVVYPISKMNKITITINAEYNFTSRNIYPYYSDIVNSNYLNFDSLLNQSGNNLNDARTIKPNLGKIYYEGQPNGLKGFDRLVFGIDSISDNPWPFDVIADSYVGGDSIPSLTFYPFGGTQRNFKHFFEEENPQIKMAYFLEDTTKINITHKIIAKITFDAYYR